MDEGTLRAFVERTAGAVTALEAQVMVLLVTAVRSGFVKPEVVGRMLDELHAPALSAEADVAYGRGMARFRQTLGVVTLEVMDGRDEPT